jgi:lipopolysaccharide export system protein LptA
LGVPPAWAEKADKAMPMNAQADAMRHDDQKQVTHLTGNVIITKGSIVMRGAAIEVRVDAQGNQSAVITGSAGKPAFFRQKREGLNEFIEGEAEQIDYDGKADNVKLSRRAVLRRYADATLVDELKGSQITYDNATDRYFVDGGASNASAVNPSGRVTAVIGAKPSAKPEIVKPSATVPIAPASGLRPSTRIGEKTN